MKQKAILLASVAIGVLAAVLAHAWLRARGAEVDRRLAAIERSQNSMMMGRNWFSRSGKNSFPLLRQIPR